MKLIFYSCAYTKTYNKRIYWIKYFSSGKFYLYEQDETFKEIKNNAFFSTGTTTCLYFLSCELLLWKYELKSFEFKTDALSWPWVLRSKLSRLVFYFVLLFLFPFFSLQNAAKVFCVPRIIKLKRAALIKSRIWNFLGEKGATFKSVRWTVQ